MKNPIVQKDIENLVNKMDIELFHNKTFLISGATGMIARYLVFLLLEINNFYENAHCKVVALCRNREKAEKIFADYLGENLYLLIQDVEQTINYKDDIDYIIHAASNSATKLFLGNPVETSMANLVGTRNLLEFSRTKDIKGFLFLSSGAVYGEDSCAAHDVREDEYYPIDALEIQNCYALSKKMAENICVSYYKEYGVPAKIVRIAHTYGPGIDLNDGHIYSDFVKAILNNEDFVIRSDGLAKRAFCYIEDAALAFFLILFKGEIGEAYNMANNEQFITIRELADRLNTGLKLEKKVWILDTGSVKREEQVSVSTQKLKKIGWQPNIGVEEGFNRVVESKKWERQHQEFFKR